MIGVLRLTSQSVIKSENKYNKIIYIKISRGGEYMANKIIEVQNIKVNITSINNSD